MPDTQDQHHKAVIFYLTNQPIITDAVFPELAKMRAVLGLTHAPWII